MKEILRPLFAISGELLRHQKEGPWSHSGLYRRGLSISVPGPNISLAGVRVPAFEGHVKEKDFPGHPLHSISLRL